MPEKKLIAIIGPTACGKTRRAVEVAERFNGEIISGDSRQVYRGMDLGTGKDLLEYGEIPYHLIDILPAGAKYNLHMFLRDCAAAKQAIESKGRLPILCGGTGMYVEAALNGLRLPEVPKNPSLRVELGGKSLEELAKILQQFKHLHNETDLDTTQRAVRAIEIETYYREHPELAVNTDKRLSEKPESVIIGLDISREERRQRISQRLEQRLEEGMVEEINTLLRSGISPEDLIYYGLEYKYLTLYAIGQLNYGEMKSQLETAIHQFAKRQMTWFRGMERRGFKINWLPYDLPADEFLNRVETLLSNGSYPR